MASAALIIMLASMFALPGVSAEDDNDTVTDLVPALDAAPDLPEPEPSPTPTPEPTPTPTLEPTLEPTLAPTATTIPEPTATMIPTAEPTATLAVPTPKLEPVATPTPDSAATPTQEPARRSLAVQSVIEGDLCRLNGVDVVGFGHGLPEFATFDCRGSVSSVTLGVSVPPAGWQYRIVESRTNPNTWRIASFTQSFNSFGDFQIYFGPTNGSTSGCGQLTVSLTWKDGTTRSSVLEAEAYKNKSEPCQGPNPDPVQCADIAGTPVTAALVGGVLPSIPFLFAPRTVTGNLTIAVDNSEKCQGWVLDVSATDLAYTGTAPGQQARSSFSPRIVLPDGSRQPLDTVQRLVSGGGIDASYSIRFTIEFDVPGGTAVGTYTTIVTLSTTAAPGS